MESLIAASVLAGRLTHLGEDAIELERCGVDWLHGDVMDGHFVDNIAFGPESVAGLRSITNIHIDVHAMIAFPQRYVQKFISAGASNVTVHFEARHDAIKTLESIRRQSCKAGLAINPDTSLESIKSLLPHTDLLSIMSVNPGFSGQPFIQESVKKVAKAAELRREQNLDFLIQVDGGITDTNAATLLEAGADVLVSGSFFFTASDKVHAVRRLRQTQSQRVVEPRQIEKDAK